MNGSVRLTRRHLLRLGTSFAVVAALPTFAEQKIELLDAGFFRTLELDPTEIEPLVKKIRGSGLIPSDEASLKVGILGGEPDARIKGMSRRALVEFVRQKIARDFRDGRIVIVDGWRLSQTEAHVWVLFSLISSR
ncbi:MAG: hypothetical protein O7F71_18950 [Gammaproteobacteria bacterium]|nr:hypothetical protein [Gammaproteobacteria bacterium]